MAVERAAPLTGRCLFDCSVPVKPRTDRLLSGRVCFFLFVIDYPERTEYMEQLIFFEAEFFKDAGRREAAGRIQVPCIPFCSVFLSHNME